MKKSLLITAILISGLVTAQTKVSVTVQSNSFTPSTLSINVGDTVEWTNVGGSHNVNGTQATFSTNPASFGNSVGSGWTYSHVFTVAGAYAYRCDPHFSLGMAGGINVAASTGLIEQSNVNGLSFYPNPASSSLFFHGQENIENIKIYSLTGEEVLVSNILKDGVDISGLSSGIYFVKMVVDKGEVTKKLIIQ